jgi:hypothetical protein
MIAHFADVAQELMKREGKNEETVSTSRNDVDDGTEKGRNELNRVGKKPLVSCTLQPGQLLRGHGSSFPRASISPYKRSASLSFFLLPTERFQINQALHRFQINQANLNDALHRFQINQAQTSNSPCSTTSTFPSQAPATARPEIEGFASTKPS